MRFNEHLLLPCSKCVALAFFTLLSCVARADIYQWEYIDPNEPSQGKRQSAILCPDGADLIAGPGATWADGPDLTKGYFIGAHLRNLEVPYPFPKPILDEADFTEANLNNAHLYAFATNASFTRANLSGATVDGNMIHGDFSEANLAGARLGSFLDYAPKLFTDSIFTRANLENSYLSHVDLTGANFRDANLKKAEFNNVDLTHANFSGANLSGALLSTSVNSLVTVTSANLQHANLTNAYFGSISSASGGRLNLSGADLRGAQGNVNFTPLFNDVTNLIRQYGAIGGLNLTDSRMLNIRDYDGDPDRILGALPLIPITVLQQMTMDSTGTLRMLFEEDDWDSLISFEPGIPVLLNGGVLNLGFAAGVDETGQIGRTIRLFDWTGVVPVGQFTVVSPYSWDLSRLYTSGEVTLVPEPSSAMLGLLCVIAFQTIASRRRMRPALSVFVGCALSACLAQSASADIYQWEYINPADPSQGKQQSTTLAPDGAGLTAAPGARWSRSDLTKAYLIGADLTNASIDGVILSDADLSDTNLTNAHVIGFAPNAVFNRANLTGAYINGDYDHANFADAQLNGAHLGSIYDYAPNSFVDSKFARANLENAYLSTAYFTNADFSNANLKKARFNQVDLTNANLSWTDLSRSVLSFTKFSNANLSHANLTGAYLDAPSDMNGDFTGADGRGIQGITFFLLPFPPSSSRILTNLIRSNGTINGLDLTGGQLLVVRDYDGDPDPNYHQQPIPIRVQRSMTADASGTLRMLFEEDGWDSLISFDSGIAVTIGGTLELNFVADVDVASQIGRTIKIFDWTGVSPTGQFQIASPYAWDVSRLYTTGEVTLMAVPEPSAAMLTILAAAVGCLQRRQSILIRKHRYSGKY